MAPRRGEIVEDRRGDDASDLGGRVSEIEGRLGNMDGRISSIEEKLDALDVKIDQRIGTLETLIHNFLERNSDTKEKGKGVNPNPNSENSLEEIGEEAGGLVAKPLELNGNPTRPQGGEEGVGHGEGEGRPDGGRPRQGGPWVLGEGSGFGRGRGGDHRAWEERWGPHREGDRSRPTLDEGWEPDRGRGEQWPAEGEGWESGREGRGSGRARGGNREAGRGGGEPWQATGGGWGCRRERGARLGLPWVGENHGGGRYGRGNPRDDLGRERGNLRTRGPRRDWEGDWEGAWEEEGQGWDGGEHKGGGRWEEERWTRGAERKLRKLKVPVFEGEDAYGWIYRVERYFLVNHIGEEEKLAAIPLCLEGQALA